MKEEPQFVNEPKWNGIVTAGEQEIEPKNNLEVYRKMGKRIGTPTAEELEKSGYGFDVNDPNRIK